MINNMRSVCANQPCIYEQAEPQILDEIGRIVHSYEEQGGHAYVNAYLLEGIVGGVILLP